MTDEKRNTKKSTGKKNKTSEQTVKQAPHQDYGPEVVTSEETDNGSIRISEDVIASVVRKYTLEVDGVIRFGSGSLVSGLAEMIGRRSQESSVTVELDGDSVNISVTLVLRFGVKVPEVAALVQDVIRSRVEELTGKHVSSVDIVVQDLQDVEEETEEQETQTQQQDE